MKVLDFDMVYGILFKKDCIYKAILLTMRGEATSPAHGMTWYYGIGMVK